MDIKVNTLGRHHQCGKTFRQHVGDQAVHCEVDQYDWSKQNPVDEESEFAILGNKKEGFTALSINTVDTM